MASELILIDRTDDGVATLTLNRPEKHNALSDALLDELSDAVVAIQADPSVNVLIVTGAGDRAFCAGRDMTEGLGGRRDGPPRPSAMAIINQLEIPTIAAVNGFAYGGGALLSLMCDLRVASSSATFRFPGSAYGLAVGTGLLASLIGPARAKDLIFTTRVVDANEALMLGLVNTVVEGDVKAASREIAAGIARNSRGALAASKRLIDHTVQPSQLMEDEADANRALRTAEQAQRFQAAAEAVTKRAR
jgi:enoyl-CoA hydratase/carnithine racemase